MLKIDSSLDGFSDETDKRNFVVDHWKKNITIKNDARRNKPVAYSFDAIFDREDSQVRFYSTLFKQIV